MNLMTDGSRWTDIFSNSPPIWWNPDSGQWEFLIASTPGIEDAAMSFGTVAGPGDTIEFSYSVDSFSATSPAYLVVKEDGWPVYSAQIQQLVPTFGSVSISCNAGASYQIGLYATADGYTTSNFYGFTAIFSTPAEGYKVYELDKGWTFDGAYIPHYIVFNWYFGDDPTVYKTMQKVRIHGLAKGVTNLSVQTSGVQTDYRQDFSTPEFVELLNPYEKVYEEFEPATCYADLSNRGLAIQVKFEGRNRDLSRPEPAHVLQVLIPQTSPPGSGFSSN